MNGNAGRGKWKDSEKKKGREKSKNVNNGEMRIRESI
jgi:hypothetical protein